MVGVRKLEVGQLKTNCYIIHEDGKGIIIDPGDDATYIQDELTKLNIIPLQILATHGHFDHILASLELCLNYKIPFLIHRKDEFLLKRMRNSARHFLKFDPGPPPEADKYLNRNSKIILGNETFRVLEIPGHTPGSICIFSITKEILFCGDLIFKGGSIGRYDFSYSEKNSLFKSIKKILELEGNFTVYPGHGNEFILSDFKQMFRG